jgi:ParB family transcriptional regulator, chromosome partitioning protein
MNVLNFNQKKRLGRGLAALIGDDDTSEVQHVAATGLRHLPVEMLRASKSNPRKKFTEDEIETLSQSIRSKGVLQPIIVRPLDTGEFEIVAGERRWRAAQKAQLHDVPVIVRDLDDRESLEIALIENIQRSDLNPLEEAQGYKFLMESYSYTQQQLAESVGKSRSHIANTLRLMSLPETIQRRIEDGLLTAGHARALVATEDPQAVADQIIKLGMSVRQAEDLVRQASNKSRGKPAAPHKDADTKALETALAQKLGLSVIITHHGDKGGVVQIAYKSLDQLDDLTRKLSVQ